MKQSQEMLLLYRNELPIISNIKCLSASFLPNSRLSATFLSSNRPRGRTMHWKKKHLKITQSERVHTSFNDIELRVSPHTDPTKN